MGRKRLDSSWLLLYQVERAPWEDQSLIGSAVEIEKILTRDPCSVGPKVEGSTLAIVNRVMKEQSFI